MLKSWGRKRSRINWIGKRNYFEKYNLGKVLNKYHIFQEDVLNNDIKDFFENEKLGLGIGTSNEFAKKHYRNSFNWFGYGVKKQ